MSVDDFELSLAVLLPDLQQRHEYRKFVSQLWFSLSRQLSYPAIFAVSGAQGCGKTTLARLLVLWARQQGLAAASVSLDDYYYSQQQRAALAATVHPLLAMRGMPGSHHIEQAIIDAEAVLRGRSVAFPSFDKALDEPGLPHALQQVDLLIIEGWCLGLTPQTSDQLCLPLNTLEISEDVTGCWRQFVNKQLALHYQCYWQMFNQLIWLRAPDWSAICRWRALQEHQLRLSRGKGMTEPELDRFMQSFQRLTEHSFQVLPQRADFIVELDQKQRPRLIKNDLL